MPLAGQQRRWVLQQSLSTTQVFARTVIFWMKRYRRSWIQWPLTWEGVFNCCHAVLPNMVAQGTGRIVNISTFAHLAPAPAEAAYAITKGAARTLTKAMVADLGDRFPGIVINDWIPGELKTQTRNPNGIEPATSAQWGVRLALWRNPMLTGRFFDQDSEYLEPLSLKRSLLNQVTGRKHVALRLS